MEIFMIIYLLIVVLSVYVLRTMLRRPSIGSYKINGNTLKSDVPGRSPLGRRPENLLLALMLSFCASLSLAVCQAFFTPQDDLTTLLIEMVNAEKTSIHGAMYMFTDKKIAQALINAKKRGVDVQLIIDQISMASCGKGKMLQENGVIVFVHRTDGFNPYSSALMHHKFFIFGSNKNDKSWLWTGSWNCTLRATGHNDENVLVLDDSQVITDYRSCFDRLVIRLEAGVFSLQNISD
jgi:phosphatidylserine/phosphatidylglycerophosphate/cardiolipin synthase-like enzyme